MEIEFEIERSYQGLDVVGYLAALCSMQAQSDVRDDMIANFDTDVTGASNA